jgi:hypothetical protein
MGRAKIIDGPRVHRKAFDKVQVHYRGQLTVYLRQARTRVQLSPRPQTRPIRLLQWCSNGQVAQSVERSPEKAGVGGSIPSLATTV